MPAVEIGRMEERALHLGADAMYLTRPDHIAMCQLVGNALQEGVAHLDIDGRAAAKTASSSESDRRIGVTAR
jgi:hypothetical protein